MQSLLTEVYGVDAEGNDNVELIDTMVGIFLEVRRETSHTGLTRRVNPVQPIHRTCGSVFCSGRPLSMFGLYTILPLPILYGVWHKQEGSGGRRVLRNRRAIILQ